MQVIYLKATLEQEHTHLHMEPESDRDRETCDRLIAAGLVSGCGYDPDSGLVIHVQIILV